MIEPTDEMIYAFSGEPEITGADAHYIRTGLTAVLAIVERDVLRMDYVEHEGHRLRVIPVVLHNSLCKWRVATPQGTTPEVLGCAGCGFCYPRASDTAPNPSAVEHG